MAEKSSDPVIPKVRSGRTKNPIIFQTKLSFALTFLFLTALTIGTFFILLNQVDQAENDALIIGTMEDQYEFISKATYLATSYAQSNDFKERQQLREDVRDALALIIVFPEKDPENPLFKVPLPQGIRHRIFDIYVSPPEKLNDEILDYIAFVKKFMMASPVHMDSNNPALRSLQTKTFDALRVFRSAVGQSQEKSRSKIQFLKVLGISLFALTILCLSFVGLLVFVPTIQRISSYLSQIHNINQALEKKVRERTVALEQKAAELARSNQQLQEQIQERLHVEKELRALSLAMENALDGIASINANLTFQNVNKAYSEMMGYSPQEIENLTYLSTVVTEDHDRVKAALEEMKQKGKAEMEVRAIRKDGTVFHQYAVFVKAAEKDQEPESFHCFARDITERKYLEAVEIKSELIQMVSHELRTPIHSVKEGISIILDGLTGPVAPEQKEVLQIAKRCADRLSRLVNDVLAFHKLEAGVIELNIKKHDMNLLINHVFQAMDPLANEKGVHLELNLAKNLPEIEMDHDKIVQVLTNILQNAIKFTAQGTISIVSSLSGNNITVAVKDTGIGIQQKDLPKLFRKFGQLEVAKSIAPGGTGLGLAISKKIVEKHHGKIEVESEYKHGSIFSFSLPINQPS